MVKLSLSEIVFLEIFIYLSVSIQIDQKRPFTTFISFF